MQCFYCNKVALDRNGLCSKHKLEKQKIIKKIVKTSYIKKFKISGIQNFSLQGLREELKKSEGFERYLSYRVNQGKSMKGVV